MIRSKRIWIIFSVFIVGSFRFKAQSTLTIGNTPVVIDTIYTGMNVPWEVIYGPDDFLWVTERVGLVSRIDPVAKTKTVILDLTSTVFVYAEAGLLGMALHPDFPTVPEVFMVYNYGVMLDIKERLVKYTYMNGQLVSPQILIDTTKGNVGHDGSRLLFLPDKTLLMSTGEAHNGSLAQNLNTLNGKMLRLNSDGTVPADNPFPNSYVYTCGHRNPQGLTLGPNNIIYSSEHGPTTDDEFQIIEKARNYGWPNVEGFCDLPAEIVYCAMHYIKEPLINWTPTIAPCDITWYSNPAFPELDEHMLMTTLKAKKLVAIKLNEAGTAYVSQSSYLENMFGRLRSVCVGPQKEIYLATNGADAANIDAGTHSIIVLRPPTPITGIKNVTLTNDIKIYPTLVKELLNIEFSSIQSLKIKVIDQSGRTCFEAKLTKGAEQININHLAGGMYFVLIENEGAIIHSTKIIKD